MNMIPSKKTLTTFVAGLALVIGGCSGIKGGTTSGGTGGGTGGSGPFTVGGQVVGLTGTGLVIENNGKDDLTIQADGSFTFKSVVTGPYVVLVKTQPTGTPAQTCSVLNGKGTATANVTNVQVTCGTVYFVGGTINGLTGTGMALQNNGTDTLKITGTGTVPFTFATPVPVGGAYAVTISTPPSSPSQTCTINNASGTVNGPVTTVDIVCPQPKYSISGTLIGLVDNGGVGNSVELKDNAGDDFLVVGNNSTFTLPTQVTNGGTYSVTVFREPFSQLQPCNIFNANGVISGNISNVQVDCQHNDWAWISQDGTDTANHYATAVLPPPFPDLNTPGARHYAMTWTDNLGRKWMFGGVGYPLPTTPIQPVSIITDDRLNDLWVFANATEDTGAWIPANLPLCTDLSGRNFADVTPLEFLDVPGNYPAVVGTGTANPPAPACSLGTYPGGRWGAATWSDASGNLFLFGGQGYDAAGISGDVFLNDLWEFTPTGPDATGTFNGKWTWVAGPNTGNKAGLANYPGGRWAPSVVTDTGSNTVWMFGGKGFDSAGNFGFLNDLWKLDIASHTWTFVAGSQTANSLGIYGTKGTAAASNVPGGREESVLWIDPAGKIWLFGGFGQDSVGTSAGGTPGGTLNDLWEYDPVANQWTWVSGGGASGIANQNGVYATQLAPDPTNIPGSRWAAVGWSDATGNLWLFGGWGYNALAINGTGFMNDTWEYQRSSQQWIWWKGSSGVNQDGNYLWHISQTDNVPGARRGQALWQPDGLDFIWIFGGQGFDKSSATGNDYLNDLWHYLPFP
jgi:hypothetical protein